MSVGLPRGMTMFGNYQGPNPSTYSFHGGVADRMAASSRTPGDTRGLGYMTSTPIGNFTKDYDKEYREQTTRSDLAPGFTRNQLTGTINTPYSSYFVPGGYARAGTSTDSSSEFQYDPFKPEAPDFSVPGTSTQTDEIPKSLQQQYAAQVRSNLGMGSGRYTGGSPGPSFMNGPSTSSVGSQAAGGLHPVSSGRSSSTPGVGPTSAVSQTSEAVGGARTAGINSASALDQSGLVGAIAKKVDDLGRSGLGLWQQYDANNREREAQRIATSPNMHANLHSGMYLQNANAKQNLANSWSDMGNSVFGVPGMFAGYALGKHLADKTGNPNYNTAYSTRGMVNPGTSNVNQASTSVREGNVQRSQAAQSSTYKTFNAGRSAPTPSTPVNTGSQAVSYNAASESVQLPV